MRTNRQAFIFIVFTAILIAFHLFGYIGHYGFDDLHYAKLANDFKNGIIDYNDHFSFRIPIIWLTSVSYSLFGVNDFASSLPTILVSILVLLFVFNILKEKGNKTLIIGLGLTTLSNWFIFYSDKLMPDMYVVFSVMGALYTIYQYRYKNSKQRVIVYSLFFTLFLLLGFMSKGTVILILPLLFYYFVIDVWQKKNVKFWILTILIGSTLFFIYFLIIKYLTGAYFKRFDAIASNSYLNLCSYDKQSVEILIKRVAYEFLDMMVYGGMSTGFIFVFAYLSEKRSWQVFKMNDSFSFWITSSVILLLSSNFMSISFSSYSPMCIDPRHYLFLVPVVSIAASSIIVDYIDNKAFKLAILLIVILITVLSFFLIGNSFKQLYLPLLILLLVYFFIPNNRLYQTLLIIGLVVIWAIMPFSIISYAQKVDYKKQKQIFVEQVLNTSDSVLVITNEVQKRLGNYYNSFSNSGLVSVVSYADFKYDSTDTRKKILFLNWYTRYLSSMDVQDLPYYAKNISQENKLVYHDKPLNIAVYEMINFKVPENSGTVLIHSLNDFESNMAHWKQKKEQITNEVFYEGKASNKIPEYSSTFEYPIDSFDMHDINQLFISCKAYGNFKDKTTSKLIISIENKDGVYVWESIEINKYIKAYSNWWPIKHDITLNISDLKENSTLKVYLWNDDKQIAYIDNFEVEVIGQ